MAPHKLQNTWVIWEIKEKQGNADAKDYSNLVREVCEFSTIEDFWKYWMYFPKPSDVFGDGQNKIYVDGRIIKAFCLFKKGIQPRWEDVANKTGSELVASKQYSPEVLDVFWENLVMGLIGETIDEGDEICGCRVVNQTRKGKPTFKIELWLRTTDESMGLKIKSKLCDVLTDFEGNKPGSKIRAPEFEILKH